MLKAMQAPQGASIINIVSPNVKVFIKWKPPIESWIKLNIDGASKGNPGSVGGGGVFRGHSSKWIKEFSANFEHCTSVKTELLALLKSLWIAWDSGYRFI